MLSVVYAESADNLAHLMRFYAPRVDKLLDVTYGAGTLSKRVGIPVLGIDKDPTSKAKLIADATALPLGDASFKAAVYDPPYLYGSKAMHMGPVGQKTWDVQRATWNDPQELMLLTLGVAQELARVISTDGVAIVKIMDSRYKRRLVKNHTIVTNAFEKHGWQLHDQIVYIRTVVNSFTNNVSAQSAHGYYLVFKRA